MWCSDDPSGAREGPRRRKMPDTPERADPVRDAVRHLVGHWAGRGTQTDLASQVRRHVTNLERAERRNIKGGRSNKAISSWLSGRHKPRSADMLIALRRVVDCRCEEDYSGRRRYSDEALRALLAGATQVKTSSPALTSRSATGSDAAALARALLISDVAAADCDLVVSDYGGRGLRLTDVYVERNLEQDILTNLLVPSLTAVRGEAGHGKTALLWRLHDRLTASGRLALLIPATALLRGVRGDTDSGAITVDDLWSALRAAARDRRDPVLLVDTLDLLTHSREARVEVHRLLQTAAQCKVPMVVACRPAEAAQLRLGDEDNAGHSPQTRPLLLNRFNAEERERAIEAYAVACYGDLTAVEIIATVQDGQVRGRPLLEVVSSPLTLRMLFELYAANGERPDPDVDSIGLYSIFWDRRVLSDRRDLATPHEGPDLSGQAERTALAMLDRGQIDLNHSDVVGWLDGPPAQDESISLMRARGILTERPETRRFWFFHQTFFEYTAARAIAAIGAEAAAALANFVAEEPYDLFYGEVASQLILLAGRTPAITTPAAEAMLTGWLASTDTGLRTLALRTYARFRSPSTVLRQTAGEALAAADERTCKDFLRILPSVSHPQANRWEDDLGIIWQRPPLRLMAIDALIRLAAADPAAAVDFVQRHDCVGWLAGRPVRQWREHQSPHLRLLEALAREEPRWAAQQAMRFWQPLGAAGIIGGLTDIVRFLARHGPAHSSVRDAITATLRELQTEDPTTELQHAYAGLVGFSGRTPAALREAMDQVLEDRASAEPWRRARLRAIAAAAFTFTELTDAQMFLDETVRLQRGDAGNQDHCATVLAELLSGPLEKMTEPLVTRLTRAECRRALAKQAGAPLGAGHAPQSLFVNALRYANLSGGTLAQLLPGEHVDPADWFAADGLGPLLADAAAVGHQDAQSALRWVLGEEGQTRMRNVPGAATAIHNVFVLLQYRVEDAPHLLDHLIDYARIQQQTGPLCVGLGRLPAEVVTTRAETVAALVALRTQLVEDVRPNLRRAGYVLWQLLVERRMESPPTADGLASALGANRDRWVINAIIALGIATIELDQWPEQAATSLVTVLGNFVEFGVTIRRAGEPPTPAQQHLINREGHARQLLVGLMARVIPLPADEARRQRHVRVAGSLVFDAAYDPTRKDDLHSFTPCATALGWLIERLGAIDSGEATDALLQYTAQLQQIHPARVKWRRTIAIKWQYAVVVLVNASTAHERQRLVEELLTLDSHLATYAVTACVAHDEAVPAWIWERIDDLPGDVRGQLRSTLWEHARETSRRQWRDVRAWVHRRTPRPS